MHTHVTGLKTLATSFKYKIAIRGPQTLTERILSSENTSLRLSNGKILPFRGLGMDQEA